MNIGEERHKTTLDIRYITSPSQLTTAKSSLAKSNLTITLDSFHGSHTTFVFKNCFCISQSTENVSFFDATTLSRLVAFLEENKVKSVIDLG
jgi:hypothetical protein